MLETGQIDKVLQDDIKRRERTKFGDASPAFLLFTQFLHCLSINFPNVNQFEVLKGDTVKIRTLRSLRRHNAMVIYKFLAAEDWQTPIICKELSKKQSLPEIGVFRSRNCGLALPFRLFHASVDYDDLAWLNCDSNLYREYYRTVKSKEVRECAN